MLSIRVQADEGALRGLISGLERFAIQVSDFRRYWPAALIAVREILSEAMESEGGATQAGSWPDLSPGYAKWKARHFPGTKILERTGRLKASLIGSHEQDVLMSPTSMTVRSTVPYGRFHQLGLGQKRRAPWSPRPRDAFRIAGAISREIRRDLLRIPNSSSSFRGRFGQALS